MELADLLTPARVALDVRVRDKDTLLRELGRLAEGLGAGLTGGQIADALRRREQLGSTGLGGGFALPHASIEDLPATFTLFVRLARPVAYDSIDERPVDLVFVLLTPVADRSAHLGALAAITRTFRDAERVRRVRSAMGTAAAFAALTEPPG